MRLLIAVGNCLVMLGGWFECLLIYNGSSLGFLYGLCFALFRSKVTSKKFTTFKYTSAVIFRSNCSKILCVGDFQLSYIVYRPKYI
jgi:multisubunit Na+/H+ antiporter MnhE subunit